MSKNIFLDLGGHYCEGLKEFVSKILSIDNTWEIYSFEPNPLIDVEKHYYSNELLKNKNLNIYFYKKAVWIKDGKFVFKMFGNNGTSLGCLLQETGGDKYYKDYHSSAIVECIDFWNFVTQNFKPTDKIYIKMDIEWAEYEILENMLQRGWPQNIITMWIEFHGLNETIFINKSKKLISTIENNYQTKIIQWY